MSLKENCVIDQKKEFVLESLKSYVNYTKLYAKYCISTKTSYKWKHRFLENGFTGLNDLSKRPKSSPGQLTENIIYFITLINI
jgi:transposase